MTGADALDRLGALLGRARAHGADAADAVLIGGTSLEVGVRDGVAEQVERAERVDVGLRVFVGERAAIASASRLEPADLDRLAERAVAMARVVPPDPNGGLGEADGPGADAGELDLADDAEPDAAALVARARAAEAAALAVGGVTRTGEAGASYGRTAIALASTRGFSGHYARSSHAVSCSAIAGTGTGMQRDHDYHATVHLADLDAPETIGRSAGERAAARVGPVRPTTGRRPVVYDPRVAGSLLGHLAAAANGTAISRGTSFLRDRLGDAVFAPGVTVIDDGRRARGPRSRPFDGEGTRTAALVLVRDGVLEHFLLDGRTGRMLGRRSTGHAARGLSGPPSPSATNLTLSPGAVTPSGLIADIADGIYVTELLGSSVSTVTGDYSRGAAGFAIRDGALAEPVAEITIAGNLVDMFRGLVPANDLTLRRGVDSPTVRIDGMTVAGA